MIKTQPYMKVSEMFYSLQGEGARKGVPTIFIRLSGCSAKHACYASGIRCDTEFESGQDMSVEEILEFCKKHPSKEITWTGGEPADQLTDEIVDRFKDLGFYQAVETSGLKPVPKGIDFVCVSPKVAEHVVKKNFPNGVSELRYVRHVGQSIPEPLVEAYYYWLSPHSDGYEINSENMNHCIQLCLDNPKWRLSVQDHKLWNVL